MPSLGIFANPPKIKEKIIMEKKGLIIAQDIPKTVCLYRIVNSLFTIKYKRSLYSIISKSLNKLQVLCEEKVFVYFLLLGKTQINHFSQIFSR